MASFPFFSFLLVFSFGAGASSEASDEALSCIRSSPAFSSQFGNLFHGKALVLERAVEKNCEQLALPGRFQISGKMNKWESSDAELSSFSKFISGQDKVLQKVFYQKLADIKKKPPGDLRIREAYEWSQRTFGRFQMASKKDDLELLRQMRSQGERGAEAQRTALAAYAIRQVLGKKEEARVRVLVARFDDAPREVYSWVQISRGPEYKNRVDLDPNSFGVSFIPLFSRRSGLTEESRKQSLAECPAIVACLQKVFLAGDRP